MLGNINAHPLELCRTARDGASEHKLKRIQGAKYFAIDEIADPYSSLPHMLPSEAGFAAAMDALEIKNEVIHHFLYLMW